MEEMYTITLSDGSTIEHLRLNGNNFISRIEVTEEDFEGKLGEVIISDGNGYVQIMHDAELVQIINEGAEWWFILRELTDDEKRPISVIVAGRVIEDRLPAALGSGVKAALAANGLFFEKEVR